MADGDKPAKLSKAEKSRAARAKKVFQNFIKRLFTGLALFAILILSLAFNPIPFLIMVGVVLVVSEWEVWDKFKLIGAKVPIAIIWIASPIFIFTGFTLGLQSFLMAFLITLGFVVLYSVFTGSNFQERLTNLSSGVFTLTYLPFMLTFLVFILQMPNGAMRTLISLVIVFALDVGSYSFGSLFGKHKLAPSISPNKTWEGLLGGIIVATGFGYGAFYIFEPDLFLVTETLWIPLAFVIAGVFCGTFGDLFESLIKRQLRIKDMSEILAGHGGMLDRLDSLLFTAPVMYLLWLLL